VENMNYIINQNLPRITTNTLFFIIISIVAFYILIKVMSNIIKIIASIAICWFILMSLQSTNIINVPLIKQAYTKMEKIIPSRELWTKIPSYINNASKINKANQNK
jgi:hypothetical protein